MIVPSPLGIELITLMNYPSMLICYMPCQQHLLCRGVHVSTGEVVAIVEQPGNLQTREDKVHV